MNKYLSLVVCSVLVLSSCGGSPIATLLLTSMSFGSQVVGTTISGQAITLSNTGSARLSIDGIAVALPFTQINTCGSSLAAGATCTITVTFAPTAEADFTSSVSITDNAKGSPQTVAITGTGVPPPPPRCTPRGQQCRPHFPCCAGLTCVAQGNRGVCE